MEVLQIVDEMRTGASPDVREALAEGWRVQEMFARRDGLYDEADEIRQFVDYFEGGVHCPPFDRSLSGAVQG